MMPYRPDLYDIWLCGNHPCCFSNSHLTVEMVQRDADRCDRSCVCWRHHVLIEAARRGDSLTDDQRQWRRVPAREVQVDDHLVVHVGRIKRVIEANETRGKSVWITLEDDQLLRFRPYDTVVVSPTGR